MINVDPAAAVEFLRWLRPGGPWDLVSIVPDGAPKTLRSHSFLPGHEIELAEWVVAHNTAERLKDGSPGRRNLYYHVNPLVPGFNGPRPKRINMAQVEFVHVDLDPRAKEDPARENTRLLGLLREPPGGLPIPSAVVFSGGGYNGLWRLDVPIPLAGTLETDETSPVAIAALEVADAACRHNLGVERLLGADHCHDIARILRLPGTVNYPNESKRKRGRTVSVAHTEWMQATTYPVAKFPVASTEEALAPGAKVTVQVPVQVVRTGDPASVLKMVRDPEDITPQMLRLIQYGNDPQDLQKYASRSDAQWHVTCELVRLGVKDDDLFAILTDPGLGISEHVLAQPSPNKYAVRQIKRARERAIHPVLLKLNDRHTVIESMNGRCIIVEEIEDEVLNRTLLDVQSFEDFKKRYCNRHVTIKVPGKKGDLVDKEVDVGSWWIGHRQRASKHRVVFRPERDTPNDYNLWRGFAYPSKPGDGHLPFLRHVRDNVCNGDPKLYTYILGWLATAVQFPANPGQTAIVMRGPEGTGKGTLARVFGKLWGRHFLHITNGDHLTGRFNGHLRDAVVVFADEAFFAGDKRHEGILKALITELSISIEDKYIRVAPAPNFVHLIVASNSDWVVPVSTGDRRYVVVDVPPNKKGDAAYWAEVNDPLEANGGAGYANLLHYLKTYDLTGFKVREIPQTEARRDQQIRTLAIDDEWWLRKLCHGGIGHWHKEWTAPIPTEKVWEDYIVYAQKVGLPRKSTGSVLGALLHKLVPGLRSCKRQFEIDTQGPGGAIVTKTVREPCYEFPPLEACRKAWETKHGPYPWPESESVPF